MSNLPPKPPKSMRVVILARSLSDKTENQLYTMVEQGGQYRKLAQVELQARSLPLERPKREKGKSRLKGKRKCGVTSGFVDPSGHTHIPREALPGYSIDPWLRY